MFSAIHSAIQTNTNEQCHTINSRITIFRWYENCSTQLFSFTLKLSMRSIFCAINSFFTHTKNYCKMCTLTASEHVKIHLQNVITICQKWETNKTRKHILNEYTFLKIIIYALLFIKWLDRQNIVWLSACVFLLFCTNFFWLLLFETKQLNGKIVHTSLAYAIQLRENQVADIGAQFAK